MAKKKINDTSASFPGWENWSQPEEQAPQPVTVLGMTFPGDEERREWFRARLRERLPELRHIEGFPIGSDDDIIALSDPPYYTACPNPWLADFIAEWEADKQRLEAEGKRYSGVQVNEPYAADVSEGKNNPIYMAHAYHTKVPHPAIMRYILHYTQPGDIVFDGFAGTGMTGVAAAMCGNEAEVKKLGAKIGATGVRHAICSDLSPIACQIAATYNLKFDPVAFERKARAILDQVDQELGWMYRTKVNGKDATINYVIWSDVFTCPNCGQEITLFNEAVDLVGEKIRDTFPCPHCGGSCSKKTMKKVWETSFDPLLGKTVNMNKKVPVRVNYTLDGGGRSETTISALDKAQLDKIQSLPMNGMHTYALQDGYNTHQPIDSNGVTHIHQFYTRRNFIYLSRVFELAKGDVFLQSWVTASLQRTTQCYKFTLDRKFGIVSGTLYIPSLDVELSPNGLLERKIRDFIKMEYSTRGNSIIGVNSATSVENLANNSVDYIFTDPPFGANIMYSELNSIWEGWLGVLTDNTDEAIINDTQHKDLFEYQRLMNESLREYFRVLKPGKWLTMEFSNTSASVWNSIQNALQGVGFVVTNVAALDKQQGSFKAVTTTTAVKQDLVISCFKPSEALMQKFDNEYSDTNVWDFIDELLCRLPVHLVHGNKTTSVVERSAKILFDRLISFYVQHGLEVPMSAQEFQRGLAERYAERDDMWFTASQVAVYDEKKRTTQGFQPSMFLVDSEQGGIAWLDSKLGEQPQTVADLRPEWMKALEDSSRRKGDIIPELSQILEENFIEMPDGRWRRPNLQDDVDLVALRTKGLLREFKAYAEIARKPKGKIKEARLEALRAGFQQCYLDKDFATILAVADRIPQTLLTEDPHLTRFYDVAVKKA